MPDILASTDIPRTPDVARRWWTEFPAVQENSREQRWTRVFGTGRWCAPRPRLARFGRCGHAVA
jgi:hypothetical protein